MPTEHDVPDGVADILPGAIPINPPALSFRTSQPEQFQQLFQDHFYVACEDGCTIREFLCEQMHVCGDYTQRRIQTVFLNGHPVDDIDTAQITAGDTVALSSAMPGLMGAMMRSNSPFKQMRDTITLHQKATQEDSPGRQCLVRMRLFNFLAKELAGLFTDNGFYIETDVFQQFLTRQEPTLEGILLDGTPFVLPWDTPPKAPMIFVKRMETTVAPER